MRIAIVGAHRATKLDAPYHDSDWEIWSLSPKNENELPRCNVWFEMHARFLDNPDADSMEYGDWLRTRPIVYMQRQTDAIPGAVEYPRAEMVDAFGHWFFNSTLSWMLALAIARRPPVLGIWGVASPASEYAAQLPALRFFAQTARIAGIEVIAPGCRLLDPEPLYGFN